MELPAVAGHTLTARRGLSLFLVGGYSPENGFNQQLLEYQLATGTWVSGAQSGTPPTGGWCWGKEATAPLTIPPSRASCRLSIHSSTLWSLPPISCYLHVFPPPPPRFSGNHLLRSSVSLFTPPRLHDKLPTSCPVAVGHHLPPPGPRSPPLRYSFSTSSTFFWSLPPGFSDHSIFLSSLSLSLC